MWVSCDDGCLGLLWLPLPPSLWDDQTPQEAEWIGFYGGVLAGGDVGGKDVHIKIKERAFYALYINVALDLCSY